MAILFYQVHTHAKLKDKLFCGKLARIYDNNGCDKVQYQLQCENQFFSNSFITIIFPTTQDCLFEFYLSPD